jgi:photosystem II stability/assembly factor-like uncharacterized protein
VACYSGVKSTAVIPHEIPAAVILRPILAPVSDNGSINNTTVRIDQAREISGAHFLNEKKGWVFGEKALFVTADAGKSWKPLPQTLSEDARLSSIFFVDENTGWLVRNVRLRVEPYALGNSSTILVTTDGGTSWVEQVNFKEGAEIRGLKFFDRENGLAFGSRVKNHKPPYDEIFLIRTNDGGRSWTDVTDKVKPAVDIGNSLANGRGQDIYWPSLRNIFLLTSEGRIIITSDGGESWKILARFEDERPNNFVSSVGYYKLVMDPEHQIRVLAGATGDEGYWADMVVPGDQNKWISYELPGRPIFDAIALSENEILACGYGLWRTSEKRRPSDFGVILYSSDSGKNWTQLYRSKVEESFISITRIGDNQFYAVSDAGTFLRFEMKND